MIDAQREFESFVPHSKVFEILHLHTIVCHSVCEASFLPTSKPQAAGRGPPAASAFQFVVSASSSVDSSDGLVPQREKASSPSSDRKSTRLNSSHLVIS